MSCIGKEVMEDAACSPIVDVMDSKDIVTESTVLQVYLLTTLLFYTLKTSTGSYVELVFMFFDLCEREGDRWGDDNWSAGRPEVALVSELNKDR